MKHKTKILHLKNGYDRSPMAYALGIGFVPARKYGKLPRKSVSSSYSLEYGKNELQMHIDSIKPGQRVFIVDDLLATGGTITATMDLVRQLGGQVVGTGFFIELADRSTSVSNQIQMVPTI